MANIGISESLEALIGDLVRVEQDLGRACIELPEPIFEAGSDRPLNPAAEIYGLLVATRQDELVPAILCLREALRLSRELPLR